MKKVFKLWISSPLFIIILSTLLSYNFWYSYVKTSPNRQFKSDVDQYYSYLPAVFIYQDLTFDFDHNYWLTKTKLGTKVAKVTYGMSVMYLPGFLIGHAWATLSEKYNADGYSYPYTIVNRFFSLFYLYLGLFILFKCLLIYGSRSAAYSSIIGILFCSNLFFYGTVLAEMPHSYLFLLFSFVIYQSILWHKDYASKRLFKIALIAGLITVIRPTDGLILFFPILYKVHNLETLKSKIQLLAKYKKDIILASVLFALPIIPQLLYWKIYAGEWLFFSYGSNERFYFTNPKILEVLFSFRNGLFVYSPVLILAFGGLFYIYKLKRELFLPIVFIFGINLYIVSCWWTWWFGGAFGSRSQIQYFPLLAFGYLFHLIYFYVTTKLKKNAGMELIIQF